MTSELTDEERSILHEGVCSRHRDGAPGVYVCRPCEMAGDAAVERILTAREAAAERRGAVNALLGAADEWEQEDTDAVGDWLRERADRIEAGDD